MKKYITTPIYYVNDLPHIGHAYTTVAADILSRYWRLRGAEVFFVTGTDEHGSKVEESAAINKKDPKEFCEQVSSKFKDAWGLLKINYDYFIRTTDPSHIECVRDVLQKLYDKNYIYKGYYEGLYCKGCEKFLSEDELVEGLCPDHKRSPEFYREENYFFKLSSFRDKLIEIMTDEKSPNYMEVLPVHRRNEILGKLKLGIEDISISRSKLRWGIPLPFDETQTAYVWIDALINYITAIGYVRKNTQLTRICFDNWWPADYHLMAKDILWFHSVIWPAILMAIDLRPPSRLFAHGFFTINGQKMSKTLGNIITPQEMIEKFGVDATRYLLLSLFPFGTDGDISWSALLQRYNVDLANNLGNLVNRTLTMVEKYFDGRIPERKNYDAETLWGEIAGFNFYIENLEYHSAINSIQSVVDKANRYIQEKTPWIMYREHNPKLNDVIYQLLETLGVIAIHIQIFMPEIARKIWDALNPHKSLEVAATDFFSSRVDFLKAGAKVSNPGVLFPRLNFNF